jgi:3-methylfumaryl-CoA hydratase
VTDLSLSKLGLPEVQTSRLPGEQLVAVAAALDQPATSGSATLPLLWHWAYFAPTTPTAGLGEDGHPRRIDEFATALPRRMWVGGSVQAVGPLRTDRDAIKRTGLVEVAHKEGKQGPLLFVTLHHRIEQDGVVVVRERQDLVYRSEAMTPPPGAMTEVAEPAGGWREVVVPTSVHLFRFSAVTFNSHRIHYDRPYARDVEHYPALVVQGPLTAMWLAASAERHLGGPLRSFEFRASAPAFVDEALTIVGERGSSPVVAAFRADGVQAMSAAVELADA